MTSYNDGKWHGWNGGECPVHPETEVEFVGFVECGFREYMEIVSEECLIREEGDFVQFIISGESLD